MGVKRISGNLGGVSGGIFLWNPGWISVGFREDLGISEQSEGDFKGSLGGLRRGRKFP